MFWNTCPRRRAGASQCLRTKREGTSSRYPKALPDGQNPPFSLVRLSVNESQVLGEAVLRRTPAVKKASVKISLFLNVLEPRPKTADRRKSALESTKKKSQVSGPFSVNGSQVLEEAGLEEGLRHEQR